VHALEEAVEPDPVPVLARMVLVLEGGNPSDRPIVRLADEVLRLGVLEERVLGRGEQRADVHPQLWDPERVAAVVLVGKGYETVETAPVRDGRDLHRAQTPPSSLPSPATPSSA